MFGNDVELSDLPIKASWHAILKEIGSMTKHSLTYLVAFLIMTMPFLAQCGGGDEPEPTVTAVVVPTDTPVPTEPPPTDTPVPEETDTPVPEDTDTPVPEESESTEDAEAQPKSALSEEGYPAPEVDQEEASSSDAAYPAPLGDVVVEYPTPVPCPETIFSVTEPLNIGDTTVAGFGPPGAGIAIIDASQMGVNLGETFIDDNGEFAVEVAEPLVSNNVIGIQLKFTPEGIDQREYLNTVIYPCAGDGSRDYPIPTIGVLFDTAQVPLE